MLDGKGGRFGICFFSGAFSLKHETDARKSFSTRVEAMDKAIRIRLSPEEAKKRIHETPSGRLALYETARGRYVRPDDFKSPDVRPLIQASQKSRVSLSPTILIFCGLDQ